MIAALTEEEINVIFGVLRGLLYDKVSAQRARTLAGQAGFNVGMIPDGLDDRGLSCRPPIFSGIDGQWGLSDSKRKARILPKLAQSLERHLGQTGEPNLVNERLREVGFGFLNGSFVPVDSHGEVPR